MKFASKSWKFVRKGRLLLRRQLTSKKKSKTKQKQKPSAAFFSHEVYGHSEMSNLDIKMIILSDQAITLTYSIGDFVSPRLLQLIARRNHGAKKFKATKCTKNWAAAKLILGKPRSESATSMLRTPHWLTVKARIEYKFSVLCYNTLQSSMPSYLKYLRNLYVPESVLRSKLLIVPKSNLKTFGDTAFNVTGPIFWNSLPLSLRNAGIVAIFKKHLKTFLFLKQIFIVF